ncbi:hypothetical protein DEO72_LG2g3023 [Vigna unguiculata]|uniref:Uncharacterized protein n=1 Tax=Vigna unguiculata TaxID=3917 RepID=A0A4D6L2G8_VIGUN|nr:hypothetical protein DEO72_LG2g3023 [Vigna unguiculata]
MENIERNELESQTEAVLIATAKRLASVVLANPIAVACMVVTSRRAYGAFLSRGGR